MSAWEAAAQVVANKECSEHTQARDAARERVCDLDRHVEETWPEEPVADLACHQLVAVALYEKMYSEPAAVLSLIRPDHSACFFARWWAGSRRTGSPGLWIPV
jgi:hypothetical protein